MSSVSKRTVSRTGAAGERLDPHFDVHHTQLANDQSANGPAMRPLPPGRNGLIHRAGCDRVVAIAGHA